MSDVSTLGAPTEATRPAPAARRYLMCPPEHFDVTYVINPWMRPDHGADRDRAQAQWAELRRRYEAAGHRVDLVPGGAGLPDMVFAANAALVLDGTAYLAKFRFPERRGEERLFEAWFADNGFRVRRSRHGHEGEGDFATAGDVVLAGTGFRTDRAAHREAQRIFGREVVTLELVDPRYYHLDTALFVLGDHRIGYFPDAFSERSQAVLRTRYPDAVLATAADAAAFGCNATCDGNRVFIPAGAPDLPERLTREGYDVVPVDVSELHKAGGAVKCCTLELRD